ncbi:ATP-binding protein [Streptococcus suis]|uniref:ATP-binding protein n=1 Tax=Streptococcus suis TaxID=1307 RepID=UPI000CF4C476|nr:ATP-binding protein [Streptococcus suis]MBO3755620.1 ATP-binding protein [Streptococcus suis]MCO8242371.1 ATP-binding protein [Streptococcus suis]NQL78319.1 ATP-binding protein [Streptococcus suis]HEM4281453.1 ATP-binding protein [Streptococcus suis]HEM4974133.1 ATP-binding protein [Streptococcus suis]
MIDTLYANGDKNDFYLGMISQVYKNSSVVQVENLSWLKFRKIRKELLVPNTINFLVVIESTLGIFLGEVYQSKLPNSDSVHNALLKDDSEKIYPELSLDIIGIMPNNSNRFKLSGFTTVGLTDRVYIANKKIIDIYLNSIELKEDDPNTPEIKLTSFAKLSNMLSEEVALRPSTLFDRHIMAVGTTNSGKSTSSLSILDKLIQNNKKVLIIDPTGEYSASFDNNSNVEKLELGVDTILDTGKLSFGQWATLFETNDSTQPAVLADAIKSLRFQKKNSIENVYVKVGKIPEEVSRDMSSLGPLDTSFNLQLLSQQIVEEAVEIDRNMTRYISGSFQFNQKQWLVQKVEYKLSNTRLSKFFSTRTNGNADLIEKIDNFVNSSIHSLYINTSSIGTSDSIGGMIIDLISNHIINSKKKDDIAFVMFIDEVHRYSKHHQDNNYQTGLTAIAREGRKKGIFLFLTTQNPQDVPKELLGQIGTLLIHRLTHQNELEAIKNHLSNQSYKQITKLNQGEAILSSINLVRDLHLEMIKSNRTHANSTTLL